MNDNSTLLDYYRETGLDISIALNYPRGMLKVMDSVSSLLISSGKLVADHDSFTVSDAKELAKTEVRDEVKTYHVLRDVDDKVWDVLKNPINSDKVRVVGVFHGKFPDNLPENMLRVDLGMSLRKKVTKAAKTAIITAIKEPGKNPTKVSPTEVYEGLLSLCYEVVYKPEYRAFPRSVSKEIPLSTAFEFLFNTPEVLTDQVMRSASNSFLDSIHG